MISKKSILVAVTLIGFAGGLAAQDKAQDKPQKNWKNQQEYDLFAAAQKDANATNRLAELDKWKQQFAESDYADVRQQMYLITYQQLNQARPAFDTSMAILKDKPNYARALTAILYYVTQFKPPSQADLDTAEKTAYYVLDNLDKIYAASNKEEGVSDADWAKQKADMKPFAWTQLLWIAQNRGGGDERKETELTKLLQRDATQSPVAYALATALLAQNKTHPEKQVPALYYYARAASYDGPNSLPAAQRQQVQQYLARIYPQYHGSNQGLTELLAMAKSNAMPPADFKIKSTSELAAEQAQKEQEEMKNNPMIGLWVKVLREPMQKDDAYFDANVKDTLLPGGANGVMKFKGKVVSMSPATRPKEIDLAIEKSGVADAKLVFENALPGKMEAGEELEFEGTAKSYTKDPFMITFAVERDQLTGWTGKNVPTKAAPKGATKGKAATKKQ